MPYVTPSFAEIRERQLRDVRNLDADAPIGADSDHYVRASGAASAVSGLYDYQAWQARQMVPDTADPEYLEIHAALRGLTRKAATKATGTVALSGNAGASVPAGTEIKAANGDLYRTQEAARLGGDGLATLPVAALTAGSREGWTDAPALLPSAPTGVAASARLTITGGSDAEGDASLLARLLEYLRDAPGGGNKADYRRWAKAVGGVADATVYPLRQGPGTVDIVITGPDGIPGADVVAACQAHIDDMRPCTAKAATVYAPVPLVVDIALAVRSDGTRTLAELAPDIRSILAARMALLRPGDAVVLAKLLVAVAGLPGIADAEIVAPARNVGVTSLQWARLGTVEVKAL